MRKNLSLVLALIMAIALVCASAGADEIPEPEGGKKFATNWSIFGETVNIVYEEEGYRVFIRNYDPMEMTGIIWEYACLYNAEKDALESVSSRKYTFRIDPETMEQTEDPAEYDGFDGEGEVTVFAIDENGMLTWQDGRGDDGMDVAFSDIGDFNGGWRNEEAGIWIEIAWEDVEDYYGYDVFIHTDRGEEYLEQMLKGIYNPATKKLECEGTACLMKPDGQGGFDPEELGESAATMSLGENREMTLDEAPDVVLEYYDPMMDEAG